MARRDKLYLTHILDAIGRIESYVAGSVAAHEDPGSRRPALDGISSFDTNFDSIAGVRRVEP